jgi:solute carrier family 35, member E1
MPATVLAARRAGQATQPPGGRLVRSRPFSPRSARSWRENERTVRFGGLQYASHAASLTAAASKGGVWANVQAVAFTASLFAMWYSSNIYFNIFNKRALSTFMYPVTCTWIHLAVGSAMAMALWLTRLKQAPQISPRVVDIIFPLSMLHLAGFVTTNASLGAVAVSLTHTIKSMEPFFTVALSWLLMGSRPAKRVLFSLLPIVIGVVVASATDISFTWAGFNAAMASNLAFQLRNVLSKKAMLRTSFDSLEGASSDLTSLDEVNIFALMSIGACILMTPIVLATDGVWLLRSGLDPGQWMPPEVLRQTLLAGVCRYVACVVCMAHNHRCSFRGCLAHEYSDVPSCAAKWCSLNLNPGFMRAALVMF